MNEERRCQLASFLTNATLGEKEDLLGVVPVTSCDDETTKRRRVASHTRFVGRRLRTFTGRGNNVEL
jgi:hypothetical protein